MLKLESATGPKIYIYIYLVGLRLVTAPPLSHGANAVTPQWLPNVPHCIYRPEPRAHGPACRASLVVKRRALAGRRGLPRRLGGSAATVG